MKKRNTLSSLSLLDLFFFATVLLISIFNFDTAGWGQALTNLSIILFVLIQAIHFLQRKSMLINAQILAFLLFWLICVLSCVYSTAQADSLEKSKTLIVLFALLLGTYNYLVLDQKLLFAMKCVAIATIISAAYLVAASWSLFWSGERISNVIGNANLAGSYLAYGCSVVFYSFKTKHLTKYVALPGMGLITLAIVFSASRSSLFALIIGLVLTQLLMPEATEKRLRGKKLLQIIAILLLFAVLLYFIMTNETIYQVFGSRIVSFFEIMSGKQSSIHENSTQTRFQFAFMAWKRFCTSPILGHGIGTFAAYLQSEIGRYAFSHNDYLEIMQGVGVVGAVPYFFIYISLLKNSIKLFSRHREKTVVPAIVILVQMLLSHILIVFYYQKLEYIFLALTMGLVAVSSEIEISDPDQCSSLREKAGYDVV